MNEKMARKSNDDYKNSKTQWHHSDRPINSADVVDKLGLLK